MAYNREQSKQLEYVMFLEKNTKEDELFIFYLQWTHNEENLVKLESILDNANYDEMYGDFVMLSLDTSVKFPESVVDLQCSMKKDLNGYCHLFNKCNGRFNYFDTPSIITEEQEEHELAALLVDDFYTCRIRKMFVPF